MQVHPRAQTMPERKPATLQCPSQSPAMSRNLLHSRRRPGTALDAEAALRGTSVYLMDRVIPMLPRRLCEELCSLQPGGARLTFSFIWELSPVRAPCFCVTACIRAVLSGDRMTPAPCHVQPDVFEQSCSAATPFSLQSAR